MAFSNPFDAPQGRFFILKNVQQQFSLWPEACDIPAGWQVMVNAAPAEVCQSWLQENWQTLTPGFFSNVIQQSGQKEIHGE